MVDRQKELYQQQQLAAHAAWASFGGSGYSGGAGGSAASPYENYMQRLQQFAASQHAPSQSMFSTGFLGNGTKDMSNFASPFLPPPPSHSGLFPGLGNYNPLPAHSPLPAHMKSSSGPPTNPLPAHMRSSPYQPGTYQSSPYTYNMAGYSGVQGGQYEEQARRQAAALHNGTSSFLPVCSSAYTQLQQLSAAYSQAASSSSAAKELKKPVATTNNNYPFSHHAVTTTTTPASSASYGHNNSNYDQIAAALLNRFGGQFNSQLMSEMVKTAGTNSPSSAGVVVPPYHSLAAQTFSNLPPTSKPPSDEAKPDPVKPEQRPPDSGRSLENGPSRTSSRNEIKNADINCSQQTSKSQPQDGPERRPPYVPTPTQPPVSVSSASISITNKIKDLQSRQSNSTSKASSGLSSEDRSELKGLWKMRAEMLQQKPVTPPQSKPVPANNVIKAKPSQSSQVPQTFPGEVGPPLIHTPRSPPHPPPPRPPPPSFSQPDLLTQPPSQTNPSLPIAPAAGQVPTSNQNERMEVKNSGIPGPSAISWKRKSCEDDHVQPQGNSWKKRKVMENHHDDPYSFEEEDRTAKPGQGRSEVKEPNNGTVSSGVYKYKSALLSRETAGGNDSDESSLNGSTSPTKKKKRPKLEEWSVNKEKLVKNGPGPDINDPAISSEKQVKKGALWGLPIVPKPPVKSSDKPTETTKIKEEKVIEKSSGKVSVNDVWLQAFGAGRNKSKKKESEAPVTSTQKSVKTESESTTILDIPPEIRRKPRPKFGGLIHFDSDWSRAVRRHHERCRVPGKLENSSQLKPKILAGQQTPKKSYEDQARKAMVSPPNLLAIEKERMERTAITPKIEPVINEDELTGQLPSIVESILENRKKLREADGRMYKIPFMKEKKKRMRAPVQSEVKICNLGLLPTPGLPLLTDDTKDVLLGSGFGNFRNYTLRKYLENDNCESDIVEPKSRRQSGVSKSKVSIKEIFGVLESPCKKSKVKTEEKPEKSVSVSEPSTPVKKKKSKAESHKTHKTALIPNSVPRKFCPKIQDPVEGEVEPEDCGYSHEVGEPTQEEKNLQFELGVFALELLEENPSWSKQTTIQNLVIWEPAEPQIPESAKRKKGKKKKARKSGLDFTSRRKTKNTAVSRAGSPSSEDVHEIVYNLSNVITESQRWVIDKNAGETILHRASKMGYPDVVAYALDKLSMGSMERDYAGLTPLHKSALKGHDKVTEILLSYGADPSAGVKGTRALHEGEILTIVYHLRS